MNALGNNSYVGVLKADTAKAVRGPYAVLIKNIDGFEAFCKAEIGAKLYVSSGGARRFQGGYQNPQYDL